jgi:hypothetical protein
VVGKHAQKYYLLFDFLFHPWSSLVVEVSLCECGVGEFFSRRGIVFVMGWRFEGLALGILLCV